MSGRGTADSVLERGLELGSNWISLFTPLFDLERKRVAEFSAMLKAEAG